MKALRSSVLLLAILALLSCTQDPSANSLAKIAHYYGATDNVPTCTEDLESALIYVEGTGFQICRSTVWETIDSESFDVVAPVVSDGTLVDSSVTVASATLTWQAATPGTSEAAFDLEYLLVRSGSAITTLAAANAATVISTWQMGLTFTDDSLASDTTYYYNVIVRDAHNNKALYTSHSVTTPSQVVLFSSLTAVDANLGGRTGADALCATAATAASLGTAHAHALISISGTDEIQDMPSLYSVPQSLEIVSVTGAKIADDWADLLDGSLDQSLQSAGVLSTTYWWSSSTSAGAVNTAGGANTCSGFTSNAVASGPWIGTRSATDSNWTSASIAQCDQTYKVLCVTW